MGWRTGNQPGHASRLGNDEVSRQLDRGEPVRGTLIEELEPAPPRCDHKRYCQECGKEVCSYKDAHMDKVWCYAHDHLTPWTRPYIVGPSGDKKRKPLSLGKRGRPAKTWFYS